MGGKERIGAKRVKSKFNKTIEDIKSYDYSMMPGAMNLNNQNVEKYMEYDHFLNLVKTEEMQGGQFSPRYMDSFQRIPGSVDSNWDVP